MKKNGIIPPHFLYFIENEGIEMYDFRSGNLSKKDEIDRLIVKLPFGPKDLEIQIIFDNYDYSVPPDFVIIKEDSFIIDYNEVIKDWNFKESSSLYKTLCKIKEKYILYMENKFYAEIMKKDSSEYYSILNISYIKDIYEKLKQKIKLYKKIDNSLSVEVSLNYEKVLNDIVLSYPLDCNIRSRNITRYLYLNLHFPVTERKFFVSFKLPSFLHIDFGLKFNEYFDLNDIQEVISQFENKLCNYFNTFSFRESVYSKIIRSNIAIPLEIDTNNFEKCSLYFLYSKANILKDTSLRKNDNSISSSVISSNSQQPLHLILQFKFEKENLIFQIIDRDKMNKLSERNLVISSTNDENEANKILDECLKEINNILRMKGMK